MSENEKQKSERDLQRDAFEGIKGRQPQSDRELDDWLATDDEKSGHHVCARVSLAMGRSRSVVAQSAI